jgi:uncharacterized protein
MKLFGKKEPKRELVSSGRFELERDGHIATLTYTLTKDVLALLETEVPGALRGSGIAGMLAQTAFNWARANHVKVDVVCPFVASFLRKHPEYDDLVLH